MSENERLMETESNEWFPWLLFSFASSPNNNNYSHIYIKIWSQILAISIME